MTDEYSIGVVDSSIDVMNGCTSINDSTNVNVETQRGIPEA